ncbi:MAG: YidC/Oxa1 family insertase periplasmic-domain containing protein [Kiritimatiellae bacterium]|nr:YidC/Oxa1 family insertase periplasmic-domain containing protein [Kiritimatiellia bacterium]
MNSSEKIIAVLLGLVLAGYLYFDFAGRKSAVEEPAAAPAAAERQVEPAPRAPEAPVPAPSAVFTGVEQTAVLENGELSLVLTTHGGAVKQATLKRYARDCGEIGEHNPAYRFDFAASPLGSMGVEFDTVAVEGDRAVFARGDRVRTVTLEDGYRVVFEDSAVEGYARLSLGAAAMGSSKNDLLSVDAWELGGKKPHVVHYSETEPLKGYLAGAAGGCSGAGDATGMPRFTPEIPVAGNFAWVALKNRFFVAALCDSTAPVVGFSAVVERDLSSGKYRPKQVSGTATLGESQGPVRSVFFIGPKKQALLSALGMRDVMEFGMWRWICYPLVWVLNLFYGWVPSFGVAIILLTVLVRLVFWPLTHKSTVGMKKMQEIQPLMKEIQAKYKDNPQRLQQETMKLYREHQVNPLSSCLPMLIQIPVFIALFNVLRSAVELRYAGFLWIPDLSEPEGLFAAYLPFGGLNILPILMAATMALQSALTPQAGDRNQQRMMVVMMPAMMLVMFYNFPSALSLYWTLSQVLSIVQMYLIRRQAKPVPQAK